MGEKLEFSNLTSGILFHQTLGAASVFIVCQMPNATAILTFDFVCCRLTDALSLTDSAHQTFLSFICHLLNSPFEQQ